MMAPPGLQQRSSLQYACHRHALGLLRHARIGGPVRVPGVYIIFAFVSFAVCGIVSVCRKLRQRPNADLLAHGSLQLPISPPTQTGLLHLQAIDATNHNKQTLRTREVAELEPATTLAAGLQQVRLRSRLSVTNVWVSFHNATGRVVHLIWLDGFGNEMILSCPSCILQPGTTSGMWQSYATHPWIARDATTGQRMMIGDQRQTFVICVADAGRTVPITEPPPIAWTLRTVHLFPEATRAAVRTLLLAHHRLQHPLQPVSLAPGMITAMPPDGSSSLSCNGVSTEILDLTVGSEAHRAGMGLESLPSELVLRLVELMAPHVLPLQDVARHPHGHADVLPADLDP